MSMTETKQDGRVVAIAGPVIDVEFPRGSLPELNSAIEFEITHEGTTTVVLAEVAQQLGNSRVRAVCLKPTWRNSLDFFTEQSITSIFYFMSIFVVFLFSRLLSSRLPRTDVISKIIGAPSYTSYLLHQNLFIILLQNHHNRQ